MGNKGERGRERGMEVRDGGTGERTDAHMRAKDQKGMEV